MKMIDLSKFAPPGTIIKEEVRRLGLGLAAATCIAVLIYGVSLRSAYDFLFDRVGGDRVLQPDAMMLPFDILLGQSLSFLHCGAVFTIRSRISSFELLHRKQKYLLDAPPAAALGTAAT